MSTEENNVVARSSSRDREEPPKEEKKSYNLFIGNISRRSERRDLEEAFGKYGKLLRVEIKPAGYGFVEFSDQRDAEDAVKALDGSTLNGSRIRVEFARGVQHKGDRGGDRGRKPIRSNYRLICEGIGGSSWQNLKDVMKKAGPVVFADVIKDSRGSLGVVEYENLDDMKHALKTLDNTEFEGGTLTLREDVDGKYSGDTRQYGNGRDNGYSRRRSPPSRSDYGGSDHRDKRRVDPDAYSTKSYEPYSRRPMMEPPPPVYDTYPVARGYDPYPPPRSWDPYGVDRRLPPPPPPEDYYRRDYGGDRYGSRSDRRRSPY